MEVASAASKFRNLKIVKPVRIITHLDSDGISSCAIITKLFDLENISYLVSVVPQLDKERLREFSKEDCDTFFFTDLGSGQISLINKFMSDKNVVILDHHETESSETNHIFVNPHLQGIDGSKEISGSGVCYLFAKAANPLMKNMSHIALIGAMGDVQENNNEFLVLNKEIINDAVEEGLVKVKRGLRLYGINSRPLYRALQYSDIPELSNETSCINFLESIGIPVKNNGVWRKLNDLNDAEMKMLTAGLIIKRIKEDKPESIVGNNYVFLKETPGSVFSDAKEFSTVLNACGRMDMPSVGIGACRGDDKSKKKALQVVQEYKSEIMNAINWYKNGKDKIIEGENYLIINAEDKIRHTVIGTLMSIISKSNNLNAKDYVLGMARTDDNFTKISLRSKLTDIDLHELITKIIKDTGGESGGHMYAAGAVIPTDLENDFIAKIEKEFMNRLND
jgi:RecJ-like exonuclease